MKTPGGMGSGFASRDCKWFVVCGQSLKEISLVAPWIFGLGVLQLNSISSCIDFYSEFLPNPNPGRAAGAWGVDSQWGPKAEKEIARQERFFKKAIDFFREDGYILFVRQTQKASQ